MNIPHLDYELVAKSVDRFIASGEWIFAKTLAEVCPHEYIVRQKYISNEAFDWFVSLIRKLGFMANWKGTAGLYYVWKDHYYWTMGAPVRETIIINRAKLADYTLDGLDWKWKRSPPNVLKLS